jgi:hypothetical protein
MTDRPKTVEELINKHPLLQNVRCGVSIGDGWVSLVDCLVKNIEFRLKYNSMPDGVQVNQVKEKFGGLRFYVHGVDDFIDGMITMAESLSYRICEDCGQSGSVREGGWTRTLCDACEVIQETKRNA